MRVPADVQTYNTRKARYAGVRGPWLEHLVEDEGLTIAQAMSMLDDWELLPYIDEQHGHMATLLKKNKEVHIAGYRRFRKRGHVNARRIAEFFKPILDAEVFLVTKLAPSEDSRFIEHLGFEPLGVTIDGVRTFILNEIKFPEARPCRH